MGTPCHRPSHERCGALECAVRSRERKGNDVLFGAKFVGKVSATSYEEAGGGAQEGRQGAVLLPCPLSKWGG